MKGHSFGFDQISLNDAAIDENIFIREPEESIMQVLPLR